MDLVTLAAACMLRGTTPGEPQCGSSRAEKLAAADHLQEPPGATGSLPQWEMFIGEAAQRFDIPSAWIRRAIKVESGGKTTLHGRPIKSAAGAMGLMQLMPGTYGDMRRAYHLGDDPFDPHDNIVAGAAYLRAMLDRFGSGAFAAYNAGPQRYQEYLDGRRLLPSETVSYLVKLNEPMAFTAINAAKGVFISSADGIFFTLSSERPSPLNAKLLSPVSGHQRTHSSPTQKNNLFVPLSTANR